MVRFMNKKWEKGRNDLMLGECSLHGPLARCKNYYECVFFFCEFCIFVVNIKEVSFSYSFYQNDTKCCCKCFTFYQNDTSLLLLMCCVLSTSYIFLRTSYLHACQVLCYYHYVMKYNYCTQNLTIMSFQLFSID